MEYKIGKIQVSTLLIIALGVQLVSIITNIISLCASTWIIPNSLFLKYDNKSIDSLYDDCKEILDDINYYDDDYDWLKEYCSILKKRNGVSVAYVVLVVIGMALMATWMFIIVKALQGKFQLAFGLILGVISAALQIAAIIQYTSVNQISYDDIYDSYGYIETLDYYGQAGDGPNLSIVVCIINSLLVLAMIFIQIKIKKLRS